MFYIENENEPVRPIALATCVLYKKDNNHYLISASHVFENIESKKIGLLINDTFSLLHGFLIYTNDKSCKIDLAIMKLADHFVKDILEQYSFLPHNLINEHHELTNKQQYLMAGFPVNRSKIYGKTHKREELIVLTNISKEDKYKKLNFDKNNHIIVNIDEVKKFDNVLPTYQSPKLYGVSGSGLWFISTTSPITFSLVGIMTEWHKKDKVAIGTKIDIVLSSIEHRIDNEYNKCVESQ